MLVFPTILFLFSRMLYYLLKTLSLFSLFSRSLSGVVLHDESFLDSTSSSGSQFSGASLSTLFSSSRQDAWAVDVLAIRNTLALYPLSIDSKNFSMLSAVFAPNVVADYSAPIGVLNGLSAVQTTLEEELKPVMTQHSYGTQYIDKLASGWEARAVTYYTASQFGMGSKKGQVLYSYGQYQDYLVKDTSSGQWFIQDRTLVYMGPNIGNISVFT